MSAIGSLLRKHLQVLDLFDAGAVWPAALRLSRIWPADPPVYVGRAGIPGERRRGYGNVQCAVVVDAGRTISIEGNVHYGPTWPDVRRRSFGVGSVLVFPAARLSSPGLVRAEGGFVVVFHAAAVDADVALPKLSLDRVDLAGNWPVLYAAGACAVRPEAAPVQHAGRAATG